MRSQSLLRFSLLMSAGSVAASVALTGCNSYRVNSGSSTGPSSPTTGSSSNSPAAFVYVTSQPSATSSTYTVVAYATDTNGHLTPISGSPFDQNAVSVTASGGYLLANTPSQPDINSYKIGSDGTLSLASQFNYQQQTGYVSNDNNTCGGVGDFIFDRTGQYVYATVTNYDCSSNNAIASFAFDPSKGTLSYLGNANIGYESSGEISFLSDDSYAYSALNDECMYGGISSFSRSANGLLNYSTAVTFTPTQGPPPPPGSKGSFKQGYAPAMTAADNANHIAIAEFPCFEVNGVAQTQVQFAAYTADSNGNLATTDTYATMPATAINVEQIAVSPSGTILAAGGLGGLQLFHFNGASSLTNFTNVLTTDTIGQIVWDNSNHLYALSRFQAGPGNAYGSGKLHVFNVTDKGATEASGSPYTIPEPLFLAVQPE